MKECGKNEIYTIKKSCPGTCLDPLGEHDCGEIKPMEGCFCNQGFVLNSKGICILPNECGCILPDSFGYLYVSQTFCSWIKVKMYFFLAWSNF